MGGALTDTLTPGAALDATAMKAADRIRLAVSEHHLFVFRLLRRLGLSESAAEEATQNVFCTFSRRVADVLLGKEKSFLYGIALRVAQAERAARGADHELCDGETIDRYPSTQPAPDEQLDDLRKRALLDELLDHMPLDLRTVFVLYELEEMTVPEIASTIGVPSGTVASRLHRARELFERLARRLRAHRSFRGEDGR
jgi:RNA polymerase sigma-70 factor, ECF subfamily